ncbi:tetratricopeptide repeat protein [Chitinophaga niastensis]|uniref:Tetratricopeptide repeat protein n=1 Tax=Chitinophaga niastensis TaxID=536980 RepID=A0A2P8H933_CHINA|nr:tetratricopeptide repeat protein [Chitinophaga niastensis]PSL42690.1 tetratricopeptide repeat protein [Chitinophaga niastensis]
MKTASFLLLCLLLTLAGHTQSPPLKDSIEKKYITNGAWHYHYFSKEWQLYLDSALAVLPDEAEFWQLKAMPYFKQRKYEVGMVYLDKAVQLNPAEYLDYRAFIKCIFQKSYHAAIADFEAAERLSTHQGVMDHSYSFYIGLSYLQLNQYDSARYYLQQCMTERQQQCKEAPMHFLYDFYMGIADYETAQYDSAITHFNMALRHYPDFSDASYYKAICLIKLNRQEEAKLSMVKSIHDYKQGYTINEDNVVYEPYPYQVRPWLFSYYKKLLGL